MTNQKKKGTPHGKNPRITAVVVATGARAGAKARRVPAASTIRILGSGFGKSVKSVTVFFDDHKVTPLPVGFSDTEILVICPTPEKRTTRLRVRVGRKMSQAYKFSVSRPSVRRTPLGSESVKFFATLDQAIAVTGAVAGRVDRQVKFAGERQASAEALEAARRELARGVKGWLDQAKSEGSKSDAAQSLATLDRLLNATGAEKMLASYVAAATGSGTPMGSVLAGGMPVMAAAAPDTAEVSDDWSLADILDALGFGLHEFAKLLDALGLLVGGIPDPTDATGLLGGITRSIGKLLDTVAQGLEKAGEELDEDAAEEAQAARDQKLDDIKDALDQQGDQLTEQGQKLDQMGEGIGKLEEKADRQGEQMEEQGTKIDDIGSQLEAQAEDIAKVEEKADRQGETLEELGETIQQNQARTEQVISALEVKADRHSEELDELQDATNALEAKADHHSASLDTLQEAAERHEQKFDHIDEQVHQIVNKLDALETKADQLEAKADTAADERAQLEAKLDALETKLDVQEGKLDREEEKLDRLRVVFPPHEGSVASQRGGANNVTAAAAVIRLPGNDVHVRAAIDVPPGQLNDLSAWSPWINFGRPSGNVLLVSVSIDLQYREGSNTDLVALLTTRDGQGTVHQRVFQGASHSDLIDPSSWSDWQAFLGTP